MEEKPKQFSRLFQRTLSGQGQTPWCPPVDVYRTHTGWLLKFDLAGIKLEDVSIAVHGNAVKVSGTRRDWSEESINSYYLMEISYNRFERTVELPCELVNPELRIEFREGFLVVRLTT